MRRNYSRRVLAVNLHFINLPPRALILQRFLCCPPAAHVSFNIIAKQRPPRRVCAMKGERWYTRVCQHQKINCLDGETDIIRSRRDQNGDERKRCDDSLLLEGEMITGEEKTEGWQKILQFDQRKMKWKELKRERERGLLSLLAWGERKWNVFSHGYHSRVQYLRTFLI